MKKKILFVASLLVGLLFLNAGLNKIFKYIPTPEDLPENLKNINTAMETIGWLLPLVAVAEIVGGILLIIPRTRALGALILFPILVGILLTHILQAPSGLPMALIVAVLMGWIMYENRNRYLPLIGK